MYYGFFLYFVFFFFFFLFFYFSSWTLRAVASLIIDKGGEASLLRLWSVGWHSICCTSRKPLSHLRPGLCLPWSDGEGKEAGGDDGVVAVGVVNEVVAGRDLGGAEGLAHALEAEAGAGLEERAADEMVVLHHLALPLHVDDLLGHCLVALEDQIGRQPGEDGGSLAGHEVVDGQHVAEEVAQLRPLKGALPGDLDGVEEARRVEVAVSGSGVADDEVNEMVLEAGL